MYFLRVIFPLRDNRITNLSLSLASEGYDTMPIRTRMGQTIGVRPLGRQGVSASWMELSLPSRGPLPHPQPTTKIP